MDSASYSSASSGLYEEKNGGAGYLGDRLHGGWFCWLERLFAPVAAAVEAVGIQAAAEEEEAGAVRRLTR